MFVMERSEHSSNVHNATLCLSHAVPKPLTKCLQTCRYAEDGQQHHRQTQHKTLCTTPLARDCSSKRSDRGLNTTTRPGDGMQDSEHGTVITSLRTGL
jgi:hypothetical protein